MMLVDRWQRKLDYLRVSVIDRCNLRCIYCMPRGTPIDWIAHKDLLSIDEFERLIRVSVGLGVQKVRLTGGEPLLRPGILGLIPKIAAMGGVKDLALSTNGLLLSRYAEDLKAAGLMRLNISLDTINPERFGMMTGGGDLSSVLSGIEAAKRAGFWPIKINTVVIQGINDLEISDLVEFAAREGLIIRFIEYMPLCSRGDWAGGFVSSDQILRRIEGWLQDGHLMENADSSEPARYFALKGGVGKVGLISPISNRFCSTCNRLRLTADGMLRVCLPSDLEVDLRTPLRRGASDPELEQLFIQGARLKPEQGEFTGPEKRVMVQIGG